MTPRHAIVIGGDRVFGASVIDRLRADGLAVVARLVDVPIGVPLDVLVADLTTVTDDVRFPAVTDGDFRALLDRQLYALVTAVQAAVPRMTAGGAIVQILSNAHLGAWGGVHVAASAAACIAMARSMAIELAPLGIRVNSVATGCPGDAWDGPQARRDVAATVGWLAGGDSGQVTGETILADRGASLRMAQAARR